MKQGALMLATVLGLGACRGHTSLHAMGAIPDLGTKPGVTLSLTRIPGHVFDDTRVTLTFAGDLGCVRVRQRGAAQLGYDARGDCVARSELEIAVPQREAAFVLRSAPEAGKSADGAHAANPFRSIDGTVEIDIYTKSCASLCPDERGASVLRLDPEDGISIAEYPEMASCPLVGSRSLVGGAPADAGAQSD